MNYPIKDKNGVEIKAGDYLYYSELPFSNHADSLERVVEHHETGELYTVYVVYNYFGKYALDLSDQDYMSFEFNNQVNDRLTDVLIVEVTGDPVEFMNANFPLDKRHS